LFNALDHTHSSALFFATTINDLDRSIQVVLLPEIGDRLRLGPDTSYANDMGIEDSL